MPLRDRDNDKNKQIMFKPINPFPAQPGPVCYYYSLLRVMQFNNPDYEKEIPSYCKNIIDEINQAYIKVGSTLDMDLIDEIFTKNLSDEIIQQLNLVNDDEPIETVEDFMGEYSHSQAMGLLLGFQFTKQKLLKEFSIENYAKYLEKYGPLVFDGLFACDIQQLPSESAKVGEQTVYRITEKMLEGEHCVVMIGCEESDEASHVCYIDPNYPQIILSLPFTLFQERVLDSGNGILYKNKNLKPSLDNFQAKEFVNTSPVLFPGKGVKRKIEHEDNSNKLKK